MSDTNSVSIGTWALGSTAQKPAEASFLIGRVTKLDDEASFSDDSRKLVNATDLQPGGAYYSIVKLQIRYENQDSTDLRYAQGTGWLIKPDLLVTAGHCVFDHTYHFGRATEVKAYIGYNGKASIGSKNVQFRQGKKIATTSGWLKSDVNRESDVGFIQLDKPFTNVVPFQFQPTPTRGSLALEVVGYPADKSLNSETGAQMYHMSKDTTFDLERSQLNMLEYTISTYAGQSGSPVLIKGQNNVVGAHVYGLLENNSASVIRGKYGNYYNACIDTFSKKFPLTQAAGVSYVTVPITKQEDDLTGPPQTDEEGFWDTLKSVASTAANVGSKVLQAGSPFLGPIGGPVAAIAGTALGFAGKMTESDFGGEAGVQDNIDYKEHCYRAVAGEAALQTILKMNIDQLQQHGIIENMQKRFILNKTHVPAVAKLIGPALLEPAVRIAALNTNQAAAEQVKSAFPIVASPPTTESDIDENAEQFAQALQTAAQRKGEQEGFLDFLKPIVTTAIKVAPTAIKIIGGIIGSGSESSFDAGKDHLQPHYESIVHRALLGDAALHALTEIPHEHLQQEGFFDNMIGTIKNIGSTVLQAAPGIIRTVTPIVTTILANRANASADVAAVTAVPASLQVDIGASDAQADKPIVKKASLMELLKHPDMTKVLPVSVSSSNGITNGVNGNTGTNGHF